MSFSKHKWWTVTVLLTAPLIALAAGVPNVFTANTPISSAQVNANFTNLADRVTALEAASAKSSAVAVSSNVPGPLGTTGKTATFTASGANTLLIIVSGTAWSLTSGSALDVAVQLDGAIIGHLSGFTNEASSHKSLPARAFVVPAPAAGSRTIGLLNGNVATTTDAFDSFNITVVELH